MSEMELSGTKQQWYVFDGQNATTGNPHPHTGRMNIYGELSAVSSKKKAMDYVKAHGSAFQGQICVAGGKQTMRTYFLGLSLASFDRHLDMAISDL